MPRKALPVGKLPSRLLRRLLPRLPSGPRVLLGPAVGEDAAALRARAGILVAASDPVTFVAEDAAAYALAVNANDVATRGARPLWFLATLLLPEGASPALARRLFAGLGRAARREGIAVVGGHSEVTAGLPRPIVAGTMLGETGPRGLLRTGDARPGDVLLLSKGLAIEAVSILAREKRRELRGLPPAFLRRCEGLIRRLSVVTEALAAAACGARALHDPTEGGLGAAAWELAEASGTAVELELEKVPVLPEARAVLGRFGLDPLGAIASGALLIAAPPRAAGRIGRRLLSLGIPCAAIGRVRRGRGASLLAGGRRRPLPRFERDELARVL